MKKLQALFVAFGMIAGAASLALASDHKKEEPKKEEKKADHKDDHKDHKDDHKTAPKKH